MGKVCGDLDNVRHSLGNVCGSPEEVCGVLKKVLQEEDMLKTSKAMKKKGKIPLQRRGFLVKRTLEHFGEVFF